MTVTWWTPVGRGPAEVEVAPVGGHPPRRIPAESNPSPGARGSLHRAVIGDLEPGHEYTYRVSSDRGADAAFGAWHRFRTAPRGGHAVARAAFVGDTGVRHPHDHRSRAAGGVLRALVEARPHVVLGGGDYAYANDALQYRDHADAIDAWFDAFEPLLAEVPFMAQFGNHEIELGEGFADWAPRLAHPPGSPEGRSYSFALGDAHVVALWAPGRRPSEHELEWLEADLAREAARRASWRIVFQHAPLVASGACHPARPEVAALLERFDALGIDLHLSAHDQSYERTHPMRDGHPVMPKDRSGGIDRYQAGAGVVCAKISPGGRLSRRSSGFSRFTAAAPDHVAVRDDDRHHWGLLEIAADRLTLRTHGLCRDGRVRSVVDEMTLEAPPRSSGRPLSADPNPSQRFST